MSSFSPLYEVIQSSIDRNDFVKITLSKPLRKQNELANVYIRLVVFKNQEQLSFTYRYKTRDEVKNYTLDEAKPILEDLLLNVFRFATVFSLQEDTHVFVSKKKEVSFITKKPVFVNKPPEVHDKPKVRKVIEGEYLFHLGILDAMGKVIPKMADKYKQINKYLEIIDDLISSTKLPKTIHVVDMGSGKGYLTFALYDYLKNKKDLDVKVSGIELRKELVDYCNGIAKKCNYEHLIFECKPIEEYKNSSIDVLIALHACDTATDDAIFKGIVADSSLIITAPCCHKHLRKELKGMTQESPVLKYGIFKERQYEMVTDTIRALLLEKQSYKTKIFEFVSNEHTRKNIMLIGKKSVKNADVVAIDEKLERLKKDFSISEYYLERLLSE